MPGKPLASQLVNEARAGASFRLDGGDYLGSQFVSIAEACRVGGGSLLIFNAGELLSSQREAIARAAPQQVTFEF